MSLKDIKQRIQSVRNTQKITSAMKLVSASKLRRAQAAIDGVRPYRDKLNEMLSSFLVGNEPVAAPYTRVSPIERSAIIAVSSNSGLCGAFNANVTRMTNETVNAIMDGGCVHVELYPVGRKISDTLRKAGHVVDGVLMEQASSPRYVDVARFAQNIMERFVSGGLDSVEVVYTHFVSAAKQITVRETLLPMDLGALQMRDGLIAECDFIVEPSGERLVDSLLPKAFAMRLFSVLLDSIAAEHAARVMAMQIATDNADDLVTELVREYNKKRQQAITNELLDIVSGSVNS